jgi:hypothetical protein
LEENVRAADVEFTPAELDDIDAALSRIEVHGARYPEHLDRMTGL